MKHRQQVWWFLTGVAIGAATVALSVWAAYIIYMTMESTR